MLIRRLTEHGENLVGHFPVAAIATDMSLHLECFNIGTGFFIEIPDGPGIMVGNHHLDSAVSQFSRSYSQLFLIVPAEAAGVVVGKIGSLAQWRVRRIAIYDIAFTGLHQSSRKIGMQEGCPFCRSAESPHRICRQSGFLIQAKGGIELTFFVIAAQAVVTMPVQVEKQGRLPAPIIGFVKFFAVGVILLCVVIGRDEQGAAIADKVLAFGDELLIQINQIRIAVGQQIFRIIGIQKHRGGTGERFNQSLARWQQVADPLADAIFVTRPLQEGFQAYRGDGCSSGVRAVMLKAWIWVGMRSATAW